MINSLVEKYWNGETSLQEEQTLRNMYERGEFVNIYPELHALFDYYSNQPQITLDENLPWLESTQTRVIRLVQRLSGVAAILVMGLFLYFQVQKTENTYHLNYTEVQDPQEAYELTMDALAFLSSKHEKAMEPLSHINQLEHTNVFNY